MSSQPADRTVIRTSVGSLSSHIGSWNRSAIALAFACAVLAAPDGRADDATAARDRGVAAVEAVVDQFHRTGDIGSKLAELDALTGSLEIAADSLAKRADYASAVQTLNALGDIHRIRDRWEPARSAYQKAEGFARQADDGMLIAKALKGQAQAESGQRLYDPAREHVDQALRLSRGLADKKVFGDALLVLAEIQLKLADFSGAAASVNQAMTIADERHDDALRLYALLDRADIWYTMGRCDPDRLSSRCVQQLDLAVQDYRRARETAARLGWAGLVRTTDGLIRHTEFQAQNIRSTIALNKSVNKASSLFKPRSARNVLAGESFAVSNVQFAALLRPMFEESKRMEARSGHSDAIAAQARFTDGLLHQMEDDFDAALVAYRSALDLFERDRGKLRSDADRGGLLANKLDFYYRPIEILLQKHSYAEAFDLFERSKSRAMADLLASRGISFPTEQERRAFARLMEQRAKVGGLQNDLFVLLRQNRPQEDIARASAEVATAERQYQAILEQAKQTGGKVHDLVVSQPASLAQLQTAMRNEGFETLMYHVDRNGLILWHISGDAVHVRNVFIPQSELVQKVRALYDSVADRNVGFDLETARELYLFLVGPARAWIKSARLVVIPDGELYQVPFEALQNPEDGRFVGDEFQLSYAPSATILLGMKPPHALEQGRLLAIADPELKAEAEAVAALYDGRVTVMAGPAPVTKKQVASRIDGYGVVHLSVHGEFNGRQPLLSYLKLAPDDDDDGRLTAAEMFGLPLDRADLVVLSACESGMASIGNGDELIGMTRALLFAGARSFVLSRWKVDAASTALWMKTFHAEAQTRPLAEAARRAEAAVRSNPAFADPHYWAAFMLVER
jgi:CHAT domain-containing protein